jgi:hypothetical protein
VINPNLPTSTPYQSWETTESRRRAADDRRGRANFEARSPLPQPTVAWMWLSAAGSAAGSPVSYT